jgi:hypothetical protein
MPECLDSTELRVKQINSIPNQPVEQSFVPATG